MRTLSLSLVLTVGLCTAARSHFVQDGAFLARSADTNTQEDFDHENYQPVNKTKPLSVFILPHSHDDPVRPQACTTRAT